MLKIYKIISHSGGNFLGSRELSIGSLRDMNLFVSGPEKDLAIEEV